MTLLKFQSARKNFPFQLTSWLWQVHMTGYLTWQRVQSVKRCTYTVYWVVVIESVDTRSTANFPSRQPFELDCAVFYVPANQYSLQPFEALQYYNLSTITSLKIKNSWALGKLGCQEQAVPRLQTEMNVRLKISFKRQILPPPQSTAL